MYTWIFAVTTVLFFILWLTKKSKQKGTIYNDVGCEKSLKKCNDEKALLEGSVERYKTELGEKQRELIRAISELRECKANCNHNRPPFVNEYIDKEESSDNSKRKSFFEFFTDAQGHYRWRFKAKNNKIVADSGEGYTTKQNLKKGVNAFVTAVKTDEYNVKWKSKK